MLEVDCEDVWQNNQYEKHQREKRFDLKKTLTQYAV